MLSAPLVDMVANLTAYTRPGDYGAHNYNQGTPIEPGGVTLVAHNAIIVSHFATGHRSLYAGVNGTEGTLLPVESREESSLDTIYDLASVTKLFTAVAALVQIDKGTIGLNDTVASHLPEFGVNGKENVTILQLATHTSGLGAIPLPGLYLAEFTTQEAKVTNILNSTLNHAPGTAYLYSDLGFMVLALVLEAVTGSTLDVLISDFTDRLGMNSTFFNRGNVPNLDPYYPRMAAQEFQIAVLGALEPARPQPVRGTVLGENAFGLLGVSGHAGLFSTAGDTAVFCQMILNNGTYGRERILSPEAVDLIFANLNAGLLLTSATATTGSSAYGFGFELGLDNAAAAGPMQGMLAASQTGVTGTAVVISRASGTFWVHFANKVHPSRLWSSTDIVWGAVGYWVAKALGRDVDFPK